MLMRENILLTHVDEPWLSEAAMLGASLVSKTIGYISFAPDLLINQNLAHGMVYNAKLLDSVRAKKARKLGWTLFFPESLLDAYRTGRIGTNYMDMTFNTWAFQVCPTRSLFQNIGGWANNNFEVSSNQKGYGGVSRQLHVILDREIYKPLKIAMPSYDQRNAYWQFVDAVFAIAFVQYMNWANGLAHTYDNLLQCYLLINGYKSTYVVRVDRWRSVDEKAGAISSTQQGSSIVSNNSVQASKSFKWSELTHSNYAVAHKLANIPSASEIENLKEEVQLLQVIRDWHGQPMSINSGFRSELVNNRVGGVPNSAHRHGYAADVVFAGVAKGASNQMAFARKIGQFLKTKGIKFDQIISYDTFIHIAVRKPGGAQRCEVFHTKRYQSTVQYFK